MAPPQINPVLFLGLKTNIRGNAQFISDSEVIYPAGGVLVLQDFDKKTQKYINLSDKKIIKSIAVSPNKKYIALNETWNQKPSIALYSLETLQCIKILTIPFEDITSSEFVDVQFTCDSNYLVAITCEPDWMLYYYNWESGKIESQTKAQNPNGQGRVEQVNCNPSDPTLVVISGPGTFRLMNVSETIWRQWGWTKAENITITTCMWLTQDRVMFGTHNGALMTVENGELKETCCYRGNEVTKLVMKKEDKGEVDLIQAKEYFHDLTVRGDEIFRIRCLTVFAKGFAFSCGSGLVHLFEKESRHVWVKRNVFKVFEKPFKTKENTFLDLNIIQNISINSSQTTLIVTTLKSQLYGVKLFQQHLDQDAEVPLDEMGPKLHHSKINDLAMCSWKPIFMTSGEDDHSIRLWNYETQTLEFSKFYLEDINSISLHPTGLFALIGFSDKLRYVVILIDDLFHMREFSIQNCKVCCFSNNGHLFAAVNGLIIQVFSTISFINLYNFKGHSETIKKLSWTGRDDKLFSCGLDGAVYGWCMSTGNRISEIVNKNFDFSGCSVSSDGKSVYVVGQDGGVKEIRNNAIIRNMKIIGVKLDNILLARSDMMLFVTGGNGIVVSIQFPMLDKAVFKEFHMHDKNITAMGLSYDDQSLITVAEDATICIWKLDNSENKAIVMEKEFSYTKEILINRYDLEEKNNIILEFSKRISEMATENAYQLRQTNAAYTDTLREVNTKYCTAIQDLKNKLEYMEDFHNQEIDALNESRERMITEYERKIDNIEADFSAKRIEEFERYESLRTKMIEMQKENDLQIKMLKEKHILDFEEMKNKNELIISEKSILISELQEKYKRERDQHEYIKRSIEDDADREIVELKASYEKQLKIEKDFNVELKGENGVLKKKIQSAQKEIENHKIEIIQLKDEHKQYQNAIQALDKNISELKIEIKNKDTVIQDKEMLIHNLRIKKDDLEKFKFILSDKVESLDQQLISKDSEISDFQIKIQELNAENEKLAISNEKITINNNKTLEKLNGVIEENKSCTMKIYDMTHKIDRVQKKLLFLSSVVDDPLKLKAAVMSLLQYKRHKNDRTSSLQFVNPETHQRLLDEKNMLMQKVIQGNERAKTACNAPQKKISKLIDENMVLLERIDSLQKEIKIHKKEYSEMKSLLGFSSKLSKAEVRSMVNKACMDYDKMKKEYEDDLEEKQSTINSLMLEIENLKGTK